ncbi:MAG: 50S ribosomal protein L25 [Phycisphaerales bacterium]|nr:50S ribosomal protein L25 [Phycisphaerales bacterium]
MQVANVKGEKRSAGGRHANERLRRRGMLPAVIYGHGEAPQSVAVSRHDFEIALHALQHVIALEVDGAKQQYLVKDVQYDHLHKDPIHIDLMRVDANERVRVSVALELKGTPAGAALGGQITQLLTDLHIECLLIAIPETLRVDIAHLGLNQSVHVRELSLPEGVKALHSPEELICICRLPKAAVETVATATGEGAAAEPEVIGRVAKDKGDEAAQ